MSQSEWPCEPIRAARHHFPSSHSDCKCNYAVSALPHRAIRALLQWLQHTAAQLDATSESSALSHGAHVTPATAVSGGSDLLTAPSSPPRVQDCSPQLPLAALLGQGLQEACAPALRTLEGLLQAPFAQLHSTIPGTGGAMQGGGLLGGAHSQPTSATALHYPSARQTNQAAPSFGGIGQAPPPQVPLAVVSSTTAANPMASGLLDMSAFGMGMGAVTAPPEPTPSQAPQPAALSSGLLDMGSFGGWAAADPPLPSPQSAPVAPPPYGASSVASPHPTSATPAQSKVAAPAAALMSSMLDMGAFGAYGDYALQPETAQEVRGHGHS